MDSTTGVTARTLRRVKQIPFGILHLLFHVIHARLPARPRCTHVLALRTRKKKGERKIERGRERETGRRKKNHEDTSRRDVNAPHSLSLPATPRTYFTFILRSEETTSSSRLFETRMNEGSDLQFEKKKKKRVTSEFLSAARLNVPETLLNLSTFYV